MSEIRGFFVIGLVLIVLAALSTIWFSFLDPAGWAIFSILMFIGWLSLIWGFVIAIDEMGTNLTRITELMEFLTDKADEEK